jgi:hypothetical protein
LLFPVLSFLIFHRGFRGDDWPLKGRKTKPPGLRRAITTFRPRKFVVYGRVCLFLLELAERSIEA